MKSSLNKKDLIDGLKNLSSVTKLDIQFREKWIENNNPILPPIGKFLISYKAGISSKKCIEHISNYYKSLFETLEYLCKEFIPLLQKINPFQPEQNDSDKFDRIFPQIIFSIENPSASFIVDLVLLRI